MRVRLIASLLILAQSGLISANAAITQDQVVDAIARYNARQAENLPTPGQHELQRLLAGNVVAIRERVPIENTAGETRDRHRFVGYSLIERPRLLVWLAALDNAVRHSKRTIEFHYSSDAAGGAVWYQHIELPWPVRDRHWVIQTRKDIALARETDGLAWEHAWKLKDDGPQLASRLLADREVPGLEARDDERAIYLPLNRGAWTMFALDNDHTLVVTHLSTVLAGWIPDAWVATFVSRQYRKVLDGLAGKSDDIAESYRVEHPVFTGDGRPISRDMARKEKRRFHASD